jgi:hypothetical protein
MLLLLIGSVGAIGISVLALLYATVARSKSIAVVGAGLAVLVAGGYASMLLGTSLISHEVLLPLGGWKYFCEIDCHIAYSVADVRTATALGPETQQTPAQGQFVIVRLKTWFDERTISPDRGNGPLYTGNRLVALVDGNGRVYSPSAAAQAALGHIEGPSAPLSQPLRPGESFTTSFVFDVPQNAHDFRLLVADPSDEWVPRMVVGHESSLLHKKIYLAVPLPTHTARSPRRAKSA